MSTPSTATAPLPPHQNHYGHSYHPSYQSSSSQQSPNDSLLSGSSRLAHSYTGTHPRVPSASTRNSVVSNKQIAPSNAQPSQPPARMPRQKSQKQPDWREFYKNGVPQEIIVIDDDTPPPATHAPQYGASNYSGQNGASAEHVNKKRKTAANYNTNGHTTYADASTPQFPGSGSETISTDRTTSLHTTAPTSLGSHGSREAVNQYTEPSTVGQKRKRVTRQTTSSSKKKKEAGNDSNPYNNYIPPSKPLFKSKEVTVRAVKDVSTAESLMRISELTELG